MCTRGCTEARKEEEDLVAEVELVRDSGVEAAATQAIDVQCKCLRKLRHKHYETSPPSRMRTPDTALRQCLVCP